MDYTLEKQLIRYNALKSEWLHILKKLGVCELAEQPLYQNIALEYATYLKKLNLH
ncbi:hypothetical protein OCF15_28600 [Bacillus cereus]|nr:hypothetical protein [Bacillus cereus]